MLNIEWVKCDQKKNILKTQNNQEKEKQGRRREWNATHFHTGHSAQGKALSKIVCALHEGGFAAYVAVSRATSWRGLAIFQPVTLDDLNHRFPSDLVQEEKHHEIMEHNTLSWYSSCTRFWRRNYRKFSSRKATLYLWWWWWWWWWQPNSKESNQTTFTWFSKSCKKPNLFCYTTYSKHTKTRYWMLKLHQKKRKNHPFKLMCRYQLLFLHNLAQLLFGAIIAVHMMLYL